MAFEDLPKSVQALTEIERQRWLKIRREQNQLLADKRVCELRLIDLNLQIRTLEMKMEMFWELVAQTRSQI